MNEKQIAALHLAGVRAEVIAELLATDGVPSDAFTAGALITLGIWSYKHLGKDDKWIANALRSWADNVEAGKRVR